MHQFNPNESASKEGKYIALLPQLDALTTGEPDLVANLANITAVLKEVFNWWWVGFYLVKENELVLGPFQGPLACTRIGFGKGVCGSSWKQKETLLVYDVEKFPGHIACSSLSRSEIVVPVFVNQKVAGVLDIDSTELSTFDQDDALALEEVAKLISKIL